jgi:hypothetical protein
MNAFYTFSKSLNNNDGDGNADGITFYNRALEKARANYDIRHRFVSVMTYELPFGKGRKFMNHGRVLDALLGGWEPRLHADVPVGVLRFTVSFAEAEPVFASEFTAEPGSRRRFRSRQTGLSVECLPDHRRRPRISIPPPSLIPPPSPPGDMGRNVVEAPGLTWPQLSLSKEWKVYEGREVHPPMGYEQSVQGGPNYGGPDSTVQPE